VATFQKKKEKRKRNEEWIYHCGRSCKVQRKVKVDRSRSTGTQWLQTSAAPVFAVPQGPSCYTAARRDAPSVPLSSAGVRRRARTRGRDGDRAEPGARPARANGEEFGLSQEWLRRWHKPSHQRRCRAVVRTTGADGWISHHFARDRSGMRSWAHLRILTDTRKPRTQDNGTMDDAWHRQGCIAAIPVRVLALDKYCL
jgi:hypothetical protein